MGCCLGFRTYTGYKEANAYVFVCLETYYDNLTAFFSSCFFFYRISYNFTMFFYAMLSLFYFNLVFFSMNAILLTSFSFLSLRFSLLKSFLILFLMKNIYKIFTTIIIYFIPAILFFLFVVLLNIQAVLSSFSQIDLIYQVLIVSYILFITFCVPFYLVSFCRKLEICFSSFFAFALEAKLEAIIQNKKTRVCFTVGKFPFICSFVCFWFISQRKICVLLAPVWASYSTYLKPNWDLLFYFYYE